MNGKKLEWVKKMNEIFHRKVSFKKIVFRHIIYNFLVLLLIDISCGQNKKTLKNCYGMKNAISRNISVSRKFPWLYSNLTDDLCQQVY